jgi:hypothetical protein
LLSIEALNATMAANLPTEIKAIVQLDILSTDLLLTKIPIQLPKEDSDEHLVKVYATAPCAGELLCTWTSGALSKPFY